MLKSLSASGKYLIASGGVPATQYINTGNNNPAAGQVRFTGQYMEVYDGNMWTQIQGSYTTVGLNPIAESALDWVLQKMEEEKRVRALAKTHPAVQDALDSIKDAENRLAVVVALVKQPDQEKEKP
jgi:hypothetical protein